MDSGSTFPHRREGSNAWDCGSFPDAACRMAVAAARRGDGADSRPIQRPGDQHCREKIWRTEASTVPKPTQVGWYKHTKARERNLVKELGTMAP